MIRLSELTKNLQFAPKRGYHAKFVGDFHISRRLSDENRARSISIRFFKIKDPCIGKPSSMYSHDPNFGTNKNRILKTDRVNGP